MRVLDAATSGLAAQLAALALALHRAGARVKFGAALIWLTIDAFAGRHGQLDGSSMEMTTLALLVLVPLLVWRIYSRLKKMMGRTESQLWRHWAAALLLPVLIVAFGVSSSGNLLAVSCLAAGTIAGGWAGVWGIKTSRFESTGKGYFYTPNLRLGLAVSMLFAARMLYGGLELYTNSRALVPVKAEPFLESPLTLLACGLIAGYFAVYNWGLLRWRRSQKPLEQDDLLGKF